jgi:hypothetical protein
MVVQQLDCRRSDGASCIATYHKPHRICHDEQCLGYASGYALSSLSFAAPTKIIAKENNSDAMTAAKYFHDGFQANVMTYPYPHPSMLLNDSIPCIDADTTNTCCVSWNVNMDDWWLQYIVQ